MGIVLIFLIVLIFCNTITSVLILFKLYKSSIYNLSLLDIDTEKTAEEILSEFAGSDWQKDIPIELKELHGVKEEKESV